MKKSTTYFGEFGIELIGVIPFAYWLYKEGKLYGTKSVKDSKCLYYFSKNHIVLDIPRFSCECTDFSMHNIHYEKLNTNFWIPPPYKKVYKNSRFIWDKPICIISNKYSLEWGGLPINFLATNVLKKIFRLLQNKYNIIYNRPTTKEITLDIGQPHFRFRDFELIEREFPEIITIQRLANVNQDLSFNELQLNLYANCDKFISVQGGNSTFCRYFGGSNIIYAVKGAEVRNNEYKWYPKLSG